MLRGVVSCCVMCYVVCSSVSLLSYVCSLSVGDGEGGSKILGGDKGAAPPRAQAPSPCRVGLAPSNEPFTIAFPHLFADILCLGLQYTRSIFAHNSFDNHKELIALFSPHHLGLSNTLGKQIKP